MRLRLLAVACTAAALPVTAALPALADTPPSPAGAAPRTPSSVHPDIPAGNVTQDGVAMVVGGHQPVTTTFTATLPPSVHGPVSALMAFSPDQMPPAGGYTWRIANQLAATCSVNDGPFQPCDWAGGEPGEEPVHPYDEYLRVPLPTVDATPTITYRIRLSADTYSLVGRTFTGFMILTDADGDVLADGGAQIHFENDPDSPFYRPAFYAVDGSGVMWRYDGTPAGSTAPFQPRAKVGAGWGVYTAVTPLIGTTAAGSGDAVARDSSGVLWYYRHSGNPAQPFLPRVKVGAGWNIYSALAGTGGNALDELSDRRSGDLVARDSAGVLWLYRATGNPAAPFAPRVKVGAGWNAYTSITTTGDGLVARDASGALWHYDRIHSATGSQPFWPGVRNKTGWNVYTAMTGAGTGSGSERLLGRDSAGKLWSTSYYDGSRVLVGGGWNIYRRLF